MRYIVNVVPNAKKAEVTVIDKESLKVKVDAVAEAGKANKRLIEILSEYFGVRKSAIMFVQGTKSRTKIIDVAEI